MNFEGALYHERFFNQSPQQISLTALINGGPIRVFLDGALLLDVVHARLLLDARLVNEFRHGRGGRGGSRFVDKDVLPGLAQLRGQDRRLLLLLDMLLAL